MGSFNDFLNALLHPQSFLGLTDLRMGTMILAGVNFVLIAINFGVGGNSWRTVVNLLISIIALVCTGLGCFGAWKNNAEHVTYYFYYCFVNLIFAIVYCILDLLSVQIWALIVHLVHLIIAIYTLTVVKGFLGQIGGGGSNAANAV